MVSDISLTLSASETVGIVGESGSGKSVTAMSIIRLLPPTLHIAEGSVRFKGRELTSLSSKELREVRGKEVGVVFQDPQNSLDPSFTIESQMVETMRAHLGAEQAQRARAGDFAARSCGHTEPGRRIRDYPHQLSGGMAQRAMIALAISCEPSLLIADEPTTALDVTVQAQILTLLRSLQDEKGMSLLLISHDLGVIAEMADRMVVMYAGEVVERGDVVETLTKPRTPTPRHSYGRSRRRTARATRWLPFPAWSPTPTPCHRVVGSAPAAATSSIVVHSNTHARPSTVRSARRAVCGPRNSSWRVSLPSLLNEGPRREPEAAVNAKPSCRSRICASSSPFARRSCSVAKPN